MPTAKAAGLNARVPPGAVGTPTIAPARGRQRAEGGRLTMGERKKIPTSEFALPGKGEGEKGVGAGSYPVPDRKHAVAALGLVGMHGSSAEKAAVRRKVHEKYPDIGED